MRFIIYVNQKSKLFRMDDMIIDFFRNEYFYEVLSISKSVVGLAFLESAINVKESILENISILDALCHHTGIENDDSFDFFEFMHKIKTEKEKGGIDLYVRTALLKDKPIDLNKNIFKYNNLAYRLLTGILQSKLPDHLKNWVHKNIGEKNANWELSEDGDRIGHDLNGIENGLNGLRLTKEGALKLLYNANRIFTTLQTTDVKIYPKLSFESYFRAGLPQNYDVYCYYGWYIIVFEGVITGAFAIGFKNQFICLDFVTKFYGIQFRVPFWDETVDEEAYDFLNRFFSQTPKMISESTTRSKTPDYTVEKFINIGKLKNLRI